MTYYSTFMSTATPQISIGYFKQKNTNVSPYLPSPPKDDYELNVNEEIIISLGQPRAESPDDEIMMSVYIGDSEINECPSDDCPVQLDTDENSLTLKASREVFLKYSYMVIATNLTVEEFSYTVLERMNLTVKIVLTDT